MGENELALFQSAPQLCSPLVAVTSVSSYPVGAALKTKSTLCPVQQMRWSVLDQSEASGPHTAAIDESKNGCSLLEKWETFYFLQEKG